MTERKKVKKGKNYGKRPPFQGRGKSLLPRMSCNSEECKDLKPRVPYFWVDFSSAAEIVIKGEGNKEIGRSVHSVTTITKLLCRNCGAILFSGIATASGSPDILELDSSTPKWLKDEK